MEGIVSVYWGRALFVKLEKIAAVLVLSVVYEFVKILLWRSAAQIFFLTLSFDLTLSLEALFRVLGEAELATSRPGGTPC